MSSENREKRRCKLRIEEKWFGSFRVYLSLSSAKEREGGREGGEKRARRVGRGSELRQPPLTADGVGRGDLRGG